jgi:hypothetical protein
MYFFRDRIGRAADRSIDNGSWLAMAAQFNIVLDPCGRGAEIDLAAVIGNNGEPMCSSTQAEARAALSPRNFISA